RDRLYYYHRLSSGGKRREFYIDAETASVMKEQISRRRELEKELRQLESGAAREERHYKMPPAPSPLSGLRTYVRAGAELERFCAPVRDYRKRACYARLKDFIYDADTEKVLILYGLRRTGKTTLIRQILCDMAPADLARSAFMQMKSSDTLADVNADLRVLESAGFRYVFIDEVTLMRDFIGGAALFPDIFAASGMKIVLSGTDSLGFLFSEDEQLFDRCVMIHTTFIPYREFESVLGIRGIDEYIRYGGTMSLSGRSYGEDSVFATAERAGDYVDNAIAKNIQHSLQLYQAGEHFRGLRELYEMGELASAINRVVEDMNHRFTVETLTRTFRSNDLGISASNLRRDREAPTDVLDRIDAGAVTAEIKKALDILDIGEQSVAVGPEHAEQIREYLRLLDLVVEMEAVNFPGAGPADHFDVMTQPGLRYVQADALVSALERDGVFNSLPLPERAAVLERIRSEIRGRMTEEIVLLETKLARPKARVFRLRFAVGEFDMVVYDPSSLTCALYEIKHSDAAVPEQRRHLLDAEKCAAAEHLFGTITGKYVLYRGKDTDLDGVRYLNVEEYLRGL
ncbi:MAG: AAA family ATPase, partial [Oscillospiraceae bacterium]|nr:AAA family ATPase [Oscillospiraceae bacterium]